MGCEKQGSGEVLKAVEAMFGPNMIASSSRRRRRIRDRWDMADRQDPHVSDGGGMKANRVVEMNGWTGPERRKLVDTLLKRKWSKKIWPTGILRISKDY